MASITRKQNGRWQARYRDPQRREISQRFDRKVDAQRWLDEKTAAIVTGQYVDPKAGKMTFREYADRWLGVQVHRPSTGSHYKHLLERHVFESLGSRPLTSILPSDIQALVKRLGMGSAERKALAPSTVGVVHNVVSSIMKSAVRDRRLATNPCEGTKLPKVEKAKVVPLETAHVLAVTAAMPEHVRAAVTLAAGTGMRQGEVFGLTVDRIDFLRREVTVDRQLLTIIGERPRHGPPKTAASNRVIPLPQAVVDALAAHLAAFPANKDGYVFHHEGEPIGRQRQGHLWRPAVFKAKLPKGTGFHALRHYYASLLIRFGESVKTVQARLGHASAAETLDTYSHLWPDSDDRTREAVDSVLGGRVAVAPADNLRTVTPS